MKKFDFFLLCAVDCRENCLELDDTMKEECLKEVMEFYSYKLIKSVFNYGKLAIYAGLWNTRYVSFELIS